MSHSPHPPQEASEDPQDGDLLAPTVPPLRCPRHPGGDATVVLTIKMLQGGFAVTGWFGSGSLPRPTEGKGCGVEVAPVGPGTRDTGHEGHRAQVTVGTRDTGHEPRFGGVGVPALAGVILPLSWLFHPPPPPRAMGHRGPPLAGGQDTRIPGWGWTQGTRARPKECGGVPGLGGHRRSVGGSRALRRGRGGGG